MEITVRGNSREAKMYINGMEIMQGETEWVKSVARRVRMAAEKTLAGRVYVLCREKARLPGVSDTPASHTSEP